jgi:hypothetical protein
MVLGGEATAYHDPAKGVPEQLDRSGTRKAQVLYKYRDHWSYQNLFPASLS